MSKRLASLFSLIVVIVVVLTAMPFGQTTVAQQARPAPKQANFNTSSAQAVKSAFTTRSNFAGEGADEEDPLLRDEAFYTRRTAGDKPLSVGEAGSARAAAAQAVINGFAQRQNGQEGATDKAFGGAWQAIGPNPIVQQTRSGRPFAAMSGRTPALAIRSTAPYTIYLGAAQGGLWISSTLTSAWTPKTDNMPSLATGAIALAPSNEDIVYVGTGEGSLSGDSYYGVGVLKSTDAGNTFAKVSGTTFDQVSISKIVVDPTNANRLFVATIRGRAGSRRVSPPNPTAFGIFESTDGGATWTARRTTTTNLGATDIVMDPLQPNVLYSSFYTEGIFKSTDGGATWNPAMNGLPFPAGASNYINAGTRWSLAISRPAAAPAATLYTGFDYADANGNQVVATVWKSVDDAANWTQTSTAEVADYCGQQCSYDNELGVDPNDPNIVFALGQFNYATGTGGIYRSMNGGASWVDLGLEQHPDFHSIAFRRDAPSNIVIGNDGGVWSSPNYGGRIGAGAPITTTNWINLNGSVNQASAAGTGTGLQTTQFTSIALNPTNNRVYGGTQDNGTLRKINSVGSSYWIDFPNGDGGQVLVDPYNSNYVYGTYFGVSPYRYDNGMDFNSNVSIESGIDNTDRSDFYIPTLMDPEFTNRLYLGTFRVYRTDNRGDQWQPISPDLTLGCASTAPNGARGCVISALGATTGGPALYAGSLDGLVHLTQDATVANPTWTRVDKFPLPNRPVQAIAVDRSNYRVAYVTYGGFDQSTPTRPGHVFKTTDGGQTWTNVTGNMPNVPVNSLLIDPTAPNTLYAGTDVGPLVSTDGGSSWSTLGTGFPLVTIWQLAQNPFTRRLAAGTHGRGAWMLTDTVATAPALQIRASEPGVPVGPNTDLTITLTIKNVGNGAASGVQIVNPLPNNTTFVSASNGGTYNGQDIVWNGLAVPAATSASYPRPDFPSLSNPGLVPGVTTVSFTIRISGSLSTGAVVTNDGGFVTSTEGAGATASPLNVTLAPPQGLALTPTSQLDGARSGQVVTYTLSLSNLGYNPDSYNLTATGNTFPVTFFDATFTTPQPQTASLAPGATTVVGVQVAIPANAANGTTDTATITAASVANSAVSKTATIQSIAVTHNVLVVDEDLSFNGPSSPLDVLPIYAAALNANNAAYNVWNIGENPTLPLQYTKAHDTVVWFTGTAYPGPLLPYEGILTAFLNKGGKLFLSGQDILDQSAGTTDFVHDYLHVDWDGSETQNDIGTKSVTGVAGNPVTDGLGQIPVSFVGLTGYSDYSNQITPIAPATAAFTDEPRNKPVAPGIDALTVADGSYKVMFLAFPFEAMGNAAQRADLMLRALQYFGTNFVTPATQTAIPTSTAEATNTPTFEPTGTVTPEPTDPSEPPVTETRTGIAPQATGTTTATAGPATSTSGPATATSRPFVTTTASPTGTAAPATPTGVTPDVDPNRVYLPLVAR